jgi:hypothetical protein
MVKKLTSLLLIVAMVMMSVGCANPKTIDGVKYDTYGLIDKDEKKNDNIEYEVVYGNVFWAIVFSATVVAPVYFFGWALYEPVGKKAPNAVPGQIGG